MSIEQQLLILNQTKQDIKAVLEGRGVDLTNTVFADYATAVDGLPAPVSAPRAFEWTQEFYDSVYQQALDNQWSRPTDWVSIPDPTDTETKFVGIYAVFESDSNWVTFAFADAYTVDWGDGTVENFNSGETASHNYVYTNTALDGTECSRGYRQAVITVTPQAGNSIWAINLGLLPASTGSSWTSKWLDIAVSGNNISIDKGQSQAPMRLLERWRWAGTNPMSNLSQFFSDDSSLQVVEMDTSSATDMNNMFANCRKMVLAPELNTASVSNFQQMFKGCDSLVTTPLYNMASLYNSIEMFANCVSLVTVPFYQTATGYQMYAMFDFCHSLVAVPQFDTSGNRYMYAFLRNCRSLKYAPPFSYLTNFNYNATYENCESLNSIYIDFNNANGDASFMFANCFGLTQATLLNCGGLGNANSMFNNCPSLGKLSSTGIINDFSVAGCNFGPQGLIEIFNDLEITAGATINISGNWGVGELTQTDRDIAINKGWTIAQ